MIWPEKIKDNSESVIYICGWNKAISACKAAYAESNPSGLVPLDAQMVAQHIEYWWGNPKFNLKEFLRQYGIPPSREVISSKEILEEIKQSDLYFTAFNYSCLTDDNEKADGQAIYLAEAIHNKIKESMK